MASPGACDVQKKKDLSLQRSGLKAARVDSPLQMSSSRLIANLLGQVEGLKVENAALRAKPRAPDHVTEQHIQIFQEDGYCLVKGLIPVDDIVAIRKRVEEIVVSRPDWPEDHFQMIDPAVYRGQSGQALPYAIQRPATHDGAFRTVADHPHLSAAMERLLGAPVKRYTDQCGIKHGVVSEEQVLLLMRCCWCICWSA
jgi:hypothetical protein